MNPLRACATLLAALAVAGLSGCQKGGPAKTKVAFVSNNPESFWTIAEAGTRKAAAEEDVEVLFRKPEQGDAAVQKEKIDEVLNRGIKALAVSVIAPTDQRAYLDEVAAKVPLITQDNDAPDTKRLCYIGTDNYEAGKGVGKLVKEMMPDGGVIAIFVGDLVPLNAQQRRQGVLDELAGAKDAKGDTYGKFTLHKTYTDQPEGPQKAKENAVNAITELQNEKRPVCFIGLWAYNPPAILAAVKDKKKEGRIKIVGFDEDPATLQGIADGHVYATVVQQPFLFGYESVKLMARLARGDRSTLPKDGVRYVPHRVITKEGGKDRMPVADFRKELDQLLGSAK
ncbi:MAG TPA: substrate-binding domain-containing protein [Gemmataceae bacterium]|jgi:ribose transport system substrate-binding protein|nr:substrate-binding domain-containing protein [Gemmataceae bacterium]